MCFQLKGAECRSFLPCKVQLCSLSDQVLCCHCHVACGMFQVSHSCYTFQFLLLPTCYFLNFLVSSAMQVWTFLFQRDDNCISSDLTVSVAYCLKYHSAWLAYFMPLLFALQDFSFLPSYDFCFLLLFFQLLFSNVFNYLVLGDPTPMTTKDDFSTFRFLHIQRSSAWSSLFFGWESIQFCVFAWRIGTVLLFTLFCHLQHT